MLHQQQFSRSVCAAQSGYDIDLTSDGIHDGNPESGYVVVVDRVIDRP